MECLVPASSSKLAGDLLRTMSLPEGGTGIGDLDRELPPVLGSLVGGLWLVPVRTIVCNGLDSRIPGSPSREAYDLERERSPVLRVPLGDLDLDL